MANPTLDDSLVREGLTDAESERFGIQSARVLFFVRSVSLVQSGLGVGARLLRDCGLNVAPGFSPAAFAV